MVPKQGRTNSLNGAFTAVQLIPPFLEKPFVNVRNRWKLAQLDCTDGIPNSLRPNWNGRMALSPLAARVAGKQSHCLGWDSAKRLSHVESKLRNLPCGRVDMWVATTEAAVARVSTPGLRAPGLNPDSIEDPPYMWACLHVKSYVVTKRPPAGVVWEFGDRLPAQVSPSSPDLD
ncbi:hypothetical protein AVEN_76330-1 [Araneus ventricosus]|uniref:Uncharacterized protein n=1 Tax=Araneus ventricosus TaxID=182803 RepID=A0A4Y2S7M6_ARAVE|nr:hypothetical protein AVEN_246907-1 [Araneus ventricosus]GBN84183.1 hypothetical protein AVEN_34036-1 [Araneus ventricosus]GBN84206.1 hypothetical protein AVEN_52286-1 [Araneus ventricosus]GBN84209.1 hypothetical protein AVEN_76330-1 [Araneus ventricosus]